MMMPPWMTMFGKLPLDRPGPVGGEFLQPIRPGDHNSFPISCSLACVATHTGMMAGKPGLAPMPVPQQSKAATAKPGTSAVRLPATASCKSTAIQQAAGVSALPAAKNDNAADAAAGDADGSKVVPEDEEVVVEPEELEVFEKVAAMERSNQQQKEQQQCSAQVCFMRSLNQLQLPRVQHTPCFGCFPADGGNFS